jgi:hypothetical protein
MPALKCPNPSCPFLFDPTQVPPGAVLACPRCGMRFTLGAAPAHAPPTGHSSTTEYIPSSQSGGTDLAFDEGPAATRPTVRRRSGGFPLIAALGGVLLAFGLIAAILYGAMIVKRGLTHGELAGTGELVVEDRNFAYRFPGPLWVQDQETRNALNVHAFALRRTEPPEAWAALEVSDFGDYSPTEADLQDKMARQLNRVFANLPEDFALEPAVWAGHDARRFQFRAEHRTSGTVCVGECYALAHRGVGYWFYAWTAERDAAAVAAEFDDLRGRFRTLGRRENRSMTANPEVVYRSESGGPRYRLSSHEQIWKKPPGLAPTDEDPKADLLLKAELKTPQRRDFPPQATLVVLVLKEDGEADDVADRYVRKRHSPDPEVFGPTDIAVLAGDPEGTTPPPGPDQEGRAATRLKVTPGGETASRSAAKLVVYSAMRIGDEVIIAEAYCPWNERSVWELRMIQLVGSLRE